MRTDGEKPGEHLGIKGSFRALLSRVPDASRYICFCDQDDVWRPEKIEMLLEAMLSAEKDRPGPILVHCDAMVTDENLRIRKRSFIAKWARQSDFFGTLMFNKVQGASSMINKPLLELVRDLPDEGPLYDRYIHMVAEVFGRRIFVNRPLMYYRQHSMNAIGAFGRKPRARFEFLNEDDKALFAGNEYFVKKFGEHLRPEQRRAVHDYEQLFTTRNPIIRFGIIKCNLRNYPGTMIKKLLKIFFP
jgi:rhamnosyltransferase